MPRRTKLPRRRSCSNCGQQFQPNHGLTQKCLECQIYDHRFYMDSKQGHRSWEAKLAVCRTCDNKLVKLKETWHDCADCSLAHRLPPPELRSDEHETCDCARCGHHKLKAPGTAALCRRCAESNETAYHQFMAKIKTSIRERLEAKIARHDSLTIEDAT